MSLAQQLETFLRRTPRLGRQVYLARGAVVVGDVTLGDYASVWYNAVLRGDINRIVVSPRNIRTTRCHLRRLRVRGEPSRLVGQRDYALHGGQKCL